MKIVNLKTFLEMPENTLFCKYTPSFFDFPSIFLGRCGEIDFFYDSLDWVESSGSSERWDILDKSAGYGTSFKMDYNCTGRDGCFEEQQLFCIYEKEDVQELIERLKKCL